MVNPKAILGAGAMVGAALSSVIFATPAGAAAPPPLVTFTADVPTVTDTAQDVLVVGATTAGSSALLVSNFFAPGCFASNNC